MTLNSWKTSNGTRKKSLQTECLIIMCLFDYDDITWQDNHASWYLPLLNIMTRLKVLSQPSPLVNHFWRETKRTQTHNGGSNDSYGRKTHQEKQTNKTVTQSFLILRDTYSFGGGAGKKWKEGKWEESEKGGRGKGKGEGRVKEEGRNPRTWL